MNTITNTQDIRSRLATDNYALIVGSEFSISPDLLEAQQQFLADWPQLEPDVYLKKGSHFRFRRFNYFHFCPENKTIKPFPPMVYYQSSKYNSYAGDVQRKFTPFTDTAKNNPFLHALIQFNFQQLPLKADQLSGSWKVQAHQMRVVTNNHETGKPTPEGMHRDEVDFVFIYMIKRNNITGGESIIHDNDGKLLYTYLLSEPLDAIVVWDPKVLHGAIPILPENSQQGGFRDVLLIGFTYQPDLKPPTPEQ
jgi:hypothetical protein